jgi:hypothetical protein
MGAATRDDLGHTVPVRIVGTSYHGVTPQQMDRAWTDAHAAWEGCWEAGGREVCDVYRYDEAADKPYYGIVGTRTRVGNSDWPYGLKNVHVVVDRLDEPGAKSTGVQADAWRKGASVSFTTFMVPEVTHQTLTKAQFIALGDEIVWRDDHYRVLLVEVSPESGACDAYAELWQKA